MCKQATISIVRGHFAHDSKACEIRSKAVVAAPDTSHMFHIFYKKFMKPYTQL